MIPKVLDRSPGIFDHVIGSKYHFCYHSNNYGMKDGGECDVTNEEIADLRDFLNSTHDPEDGSDQKEGHEIRVDLILEDGMPNEGYKIDVRPLSPQKDSSSSSSYPKQGDVPTYILKASTLHGLFNGSRTLACLKITGRSLPTSIEDCPRFEYRGFMLDLARHFFSFDFLKHLIRLLSLFKINILHLHLTDDQGWRIEIPGYPMLTTRGGQSSINSDPNGRGFLTSAQFKELVEYASRYFIEIVPEIDIPGHCGALLYSYPKKFESYSEPPTEPITENSYVLWKEKKVCYSLKWSDKVYLLLMHVFEFLSPLCRRIHIGGDEAKNMPKAEYAEFIKNVEKMVSVNFPGVRLIGWQEIAKADLDPYTLVHYWISPGRYSERRKVGVHSGNEKDGKRKLGDDDDDEEKKTVVVPSSYVQKAIENGNGFIMSPADRIYLDMKYNSKTPLGLPWAGPIGVRKAYMWDPTLYALGIEEKNVKGVEAPLWSETLKSEEDVHHMMFPRVIALAEIGWSHKDVRDVKDFMLRLKLFKEFLKKVTPGCFDQF